MDVSLLAVFEKGVKKNKMKKRELIESVGDCQLEKYSID